MQVKILLQIVNLLAIAEAMHPVLRNRRITVPVYNKIKEISATCDAKFLNVTVRMEEPFKGIVFAKEFSKDCQQEGNHTKELTISLITSNCGIRLSRENYLNKKENIMVYDVTLIVQQDKYLRQITDQERTVQCFIKEDNFKVDSARVNEEFLKLYKREHRTGRKKDEKWDDEEEQKLSASRAWMEIIPADEDLTKEVLQVGEPTLLIVKSTLPSTIGWKIVNCSAHDGLGDSSQKLIDENGCPFDELLLPALLKGAPKPMAFMRHQEAVSRFAAFKFPDRDRLHLSCELVLCKGSCKKVFFFLICTYLSKFNEIILGRLFKKRRN